MSSPPPPLLVPPLLSPSSAATAFDITLPPAASVRMKGRRGRLFW